MKAEEEPKRGTCRRTRLERGRGGGGGGAWKIHELWQLIHSQLVPNQKKLMTPKLALGWPVCIGWSYCSAT